MPYGPRYGRMEAPEDPKRARKLELVNEAINERELSWVVNTRHAKESWRVLVYDLQWREGMPGALVIVDRDTDMDVKIYAPGMWFDVDTMVPTADHDDFENWKPQAAYLVDLADRLIQEEQERPE